MKDIKLNTKGVKISDLATAQETIKEINIRIRHTSQSIGEGGLERIKKGEDEVAKRELEIHLEDINPLVKKLTDYYNSLCRDEWNDDYEEKREIQKSIWGDLDDIIKRIKALNIVVELKDYGKN